MVIIQNNFSVVCSKFKSLMLLSLVVFGLSISVKAGQSKKSFAVINSIHYNDKGDLSKYGLKNYTVFYSTHIWPKKVRVGNRRSKTVPSDEHIAKITKAIPKGRGPAVYDIEHWPLDIRTAVRAAADDDILAASKKAVDASMTKMIHIIETSKKANPSIKYGYYSCLPLRDYWAPVKNDAEKIKKWKEANDYLKPLADSVGVICPSLYTFYPNREAWLKYAKANIAEAKRIANGKPIYVYIWPKYHNSNKRDGKKFIEGDFWKLQLETIYNSGVDGIIIWDSPRVVNNPKDKLWDPKREWWQETVKFMERIKK